ncbi:MAG: hypothetical protein IKC69_04720 [Clostridia bacterium]|nr:hypothetical protein [Clostridia bacterium]
MKKKKKELLEADFSEKETEKENEAEGAEASFEERMEEDIALFRNLFPEVKGEEIPDEVWERVEKGESLAAAFALHFVQKLRQEEKIRTVNEENEKKAPPRIHRDSGEGEYFSPEAVKAMSPKEVKKHYDAILRSMEHWS